MFVWSATLPFLAILSAVLLVWQWIAARRFPLRANVATKFAPGITLLKPLKGADAETRACLTSWMEQEYGGPMQILFGVRFPDDPVCDIVRDLLGKYPHVDAELVICPDSLGLNAKISTVVQLEQNAKHEILGLSDADVWCDKTFLTETVAHFEQPLTGLVCSFYSLRGAQNLAMHLESLAVNVDFWSQVLQGATISRVKFALGAVMLIRRDVLARINGFGGVVNFLADDYQLGHRVAGQGDTVQIANTPVECRNAPSSARDIWLHQLRWARTIRVCQPTPYFFSILSNPTFWPLLWACLAPSPASQLFLGLAIGLRLVIGANLQDRLLGVGSKKSPIVLILLKDLLQVAVWASAFMGNRIVWRGDVFKVLRTGELQKIVTDRQS